MNMIRRDETGDTGEQDVRELRRLYGDGPEVPPTLPLTDNGPFVRDKEDVPHEDAIPDLYGLDNASEDDAVEEILLQMVEDGELCFGWLEDRQEFGFWYAEDASEPVTPEPVPAPARVSRRRPKRPLARRILVGVAATFAAPFAIGLCAYAAEQGEHHAHPVDQPDLTSDDVPVGGKDREADYQPLGASSAPIPTPSSTKRARHAKPSVHPEKPKAAASAAKHAKKAATATKGPAALPTGIPTIKVTLPSPVPTAAKHDGPLGMVVKAVLAPVGALLGN
jgi:hypothetical protein